MSTFGIVHRFPGGNAEQYDASVADVHPADGLPEGQTYHAAGPTDDGAWIVVALWDSKESWDRFRDETLIPGFERLGERGLGTPQETTFEIHNEQHG